jgi:oxaloacetate decarboxylase alpha subunit
VLRDMMQSTGVWTFDTDQLKAMAVEAAQAGFSHLEIGGGQSYQIALQNAANPYRLIAAIKRELESKSCTMPLQILLRGANQFGFHHYCSDVQKSNLDLLVEAGGDSKRSNALIIRVFDALNDLENLRFSIEYLVQKNAAAALSGAKQVQIQVALSYVAPKNIADQDGCYSIAYYLGYARALQAIAKLAGGELDSICIKDMSGQLDPETAQQLVRELVTLGLPVVLHCHSTDESKSLAVLLAAAKAGVNTVETAIAPLAGGASHHDVVHLRCFEEFEALNAVNIAAIQKRLSMLFNQKTVAHRKDWTLALNSLKQLANKGIPGGAIPFIVQDLQDHVCSVLSLDLTEAINAFSDELDRLQQQLGNMPLVTPTADIIAKQVIKNLGNQVRADKYQLIDPRFCSLVLGHYGNVVNHANGQHIAVDPRLVEQIQSYCKTISLDLNGRRSKSGKIYPEPEVLEQHPSTLANSQDYREAQAYVDELVSRYPESVQRFGSIEQCVMMHVMRPAGNNERLLTHNVLGPTERHLRFLLQRTLHLLPARTVPEARQETLNEETDIALLKALGDYEGIVNSIKDLVMGSESGQIHQRLSQMMTQVVDEICENNAEAQAHRYYIERRFVALYAAAVFWDLQRICRRTGGDSRIDIDEMTANSLGKIISTTLRKRLHDGRSKPQSYLV